MTNRALVRSRPLLLGVGGVVPAGLVRPIRGEDPVEQIGPWREKVQVIADEHPEAHAEGGLERGAVGRCTLVEEALLLLLPLMMSAMIEITIVTSFVGDSVGEKVR